MLLLGVRLVGDFFDKFVANELQKHLAPQIGGKVGARSCKTAAKSSEIVANSCKRVADELQRMPNMLK